MGKQCDMKAHGQYAEAYFQVFFKCTFKIKGSSKLNGSIALNDFKLYSLQKDFQSAPLVQHGLIYLTKNVNQ